MKFIVDAQLPKSLATWLRSKGHDADHLRDLGLDTLDDFAVFEVARDRRAIVVSKDQDFIEIQRLRGGPQIIWIRLGNVNNAALSAKLQSVWGRVELLLANGRSVIEIR